MPGDTTFGTFSMPTYMKTYSLYMYPSNLSNLKHCTKALFLNFTIHLLFPTITYYDWTFYYILYYIIFYYYYIHLYHELLDYLFRITGTGGRRDQSIPHLLLFGTCHPSMCAKAWRPHFAWLPVPPQPAYPSSPAADRPATCHHVCGLVSPALPACIPSPLPSLFSVSACCGLLCAFAACLPCCVSACHVVMPCPTCVALCACHFDMPAFSSAMPCMPVTVVATTCGSPPHACTPAVYVHLLPATITPKPAT